MEKNEGRAKVGGTESNEPLVSVGIPTYNRPVELRRVLSQLLEQTYKNIEIIILDNCSTLKEVEQVAREFAASHANIKYVRNDSNLGVLRNTANLIQHANGEFFCWVSDDDYRSIDFIERTLTCLRRTRDSVAVFCDFREVDVENSQSPSYPINHSELMWFFSSKHKLFRRVMYYLSSAACGKCNALYSLFRTEALKKMDFSELSDSFTALNMDCMIVYQTLALGPIPILNFEGCRLTVGNKKNYQNMSTDTNAMKKLLSLLEELNWDRRKYYKLSDPVERVLITLLFPGKVAAEILRSALGLKCFSPFARSAK